MSARGPLGHSLQLLLVLKVTAVIDSQSGDLEDVLNCPQIVLRAYRPVVSIRQPRSSVLTERSADVLKYLDRVCLADLWYKWTVCGL